MINSLLYSNDYMYKFETNINKMLLCYYNYMNIFMFKILFYQQDPFLKVLPSSHWLIMDPPTFIPKL